MSGKSRLLKSLGILIAGSLAALFAFAAPTQAATGINQQLSFQGKVVKSDGTNIPDGTYDMEFKIYQDGNSSGTGSTLMWTEDYLVSGSTGMPSTGGVTVTAGTFQVNLGSVCALAGGTCSAKTNTGVDFNQDTLWLSFEVGNTSSCTVTSSTTSFHTGCGGDGAMTPFIRLTAVPQAMNANKVGGLTASQLVQLSPSSQQSGSINVSGNINTAGTLSSSQTGAVAISLSGTPASSATSSLIQAAGAIANGSVSGNYIGINPSSFSGNFIELEVNGTTKLKVAATGATLIQSGTDSVTTLLDLNTGVHGGTQFDIGGTSNNESTLSLNVYRAGTYTPRLQVLSDGNMVLQGTSGNVGIGDPSPVALLTVGNGDKLQVDGNGNVTTSGAVTVTSANGLTLGSTSNTGTILFQDGTSNARAITLTTPALTNSYSLTLANTGASGSQCLQSGSGSTTSATTLQWGSCVAWPLAYSGTQSFQPSGVANNALSIVNNASAVNGVTITGTASGTAPIISSNTDLAFQPATGLVMLNRPSTNNELRVYENSATPTKYATITYNGSTNTAIFGASTGTVQFGAASGPVSVPLTGQNDNFIFTKTYTPVATYSLTDFGITRTLTAGSNLANGNIASIQDTSSGTNGSSAPNVLYLNQNNTTFGGNLIQAQTGGSSTRFSVDVAGNVMASNGYKTGSNTGSTVSCSGSQWVQGTVVSGGIITGGSCAGSSTTLQNTYDNSTSPATITTSSSSKGILFKAGSGNDSTSLFSVQGSSLQLLTVDSVNSTVQVGSGTTDGSVVTLQLDSVNTYGAAPTCTSTTNQGALFYNTVSNTVRACVNSNWEDLISTSGLGIMAFGVIADTGLSQGDVDGVTGLTNSPCKVTWASTTSVSVAPCVYFSGGRKNVLSATQTISGLSGASTWYHICANGTNNTFQANSGTETTGLPTFSTNNPVLCVADVLTGSGGTITNIYDVRTFTDVLKRFFTASTATGLGQVVVQDTTGNGLVKTVATTGSAGIDGVVVATTGASSTNTINVVVATRGALFAKTSGTGASLGKYAETLNTPLGYVTGTTATLGKVLGPIYDAADTACNASTNCQYSVYVDGRW